MPEQPEDLQGHNCLLLRFPGSQQYQWSLNTPDGPVKVSVAGSFDADYGDVLTDWLLAGHGIAMKPVAFTRVKPGETLIAAASAAA